MPTQSKTSSRVLARYLKACQGGCTCGGACGGACKSGCSTGACSLKEVSAMALRVADAFQAQHLKSTDGYEPPKVG